MKHLLRKRFARAKSRSPLKAKPLRLPGQSLQDELERNVEDGFIPYLLAAAVLLWGAIMEWLAVWARFPRLPWVYSTLAALATGLCVRQFYRTRRLVKRLKQGRDGEQAVGQYLERLRQQSVQVFHDVVGEGFNLDHVILGPRGFFVIETKTWSKPVDGDSKITLHNRSLYINGRPPERDPISQAEAGARWLAKLLQESCGKPFPVKSVVLLPGWFVEPMSIEWKATLPWVLEPKALPKFLRQEPPLHAMEDVYLAGFHLSRYIRTTDRTIAPARDA